MPSPSLTPLEASLRTRATSATGISSFNSTSRETDMSFALSSATVLSAPAPYHLTS